MDMEGSKDLSHAVARALRAVRSFGKVDGDKAAEHISALRSHLANQPEGTILSSTRDLKAVSLIFDYEDSQGLPFSAAISTVGDAILRNRTKKIQEIFAQFNDSSARMKWMRQIVWVMLAHALWFHRQNKLSRMSGILSAAKELVDRNLLPEAEHPGTLSRWNYYRGLQLRDQGDFQGAMEHFVQSFQYAQQRRSIKREQLKSRALAKEDAEVKEDFEVEEAFTRACLARIQAFGFGEVAFFRGDLTGSSAWFKTALMTLEGEGLERWKLSVQVYLEGSRILISPFTTEGAKRVQAAIENLDGLAGRLRGLHKGYADLSRAFANLGHIRLEQIHCIQRDSSAEALQVDLKQPLQIPYQTPIASVQEVDENNTKPNRPHGAISALISLVNAEVLLRCKRIDDSSAEVRWIRNQLAFNAFAQVEADLLEAQILMVQGDWKRAARILEKDRNLDYRANRNQRALWLALASTVQYTLQNSLSARIFALRARSVANHVGDGFIKHFVQLAVSRALPESTSIFPMPYQNEPPNLSLRDNRDAVDRTLIQTILNLHPGIKSPEELAPFLGVSRAAIYKQVDKRLLDEFFKKTRPKTIIETVSVGGIPK
jgi:hypothetical protein